MILLLQQLVLFTSRFIQEWAILLTGTAISFVLFISQFSNHTKNIPTWLWKTGLALTVILAFFQIWRKEYDEHDRLKKRVEAEGEYKFNSLIAEIQTGPVARPNGQIATHVTAFVSINNIGRPTITEGFYLSIPSLHIKDVRMTNPAFPLRLNRLGQVIEVHNEDMIDIITAKNPIPSGAAKRGWAHYVIHGVSEDQLNKAQSFEIAFWDVTGKQHTISLSRNNETIYRPDSYPGRPTFPVIR